MAAIDLRTESLVPGAPEPVTVAAAELVAAAAQATTEGVPVCEDDDGSKSEVVVESRAASAASGRSAMPGPLAGAGGRPSRASMAKMGLLGRLPVSGRSGGLPRSAGLWACGYAR